MGLRERKNKLIVVLRAHVASKALTGEQAETFERMYRNARTPEEQDQVTAAVRHQLDGWKTEGDRYSRVLRDVFDVDSLDEEDEDPPALTEALKRSRISFIRK
jgi:predicted oxidoreductase